MINDSLSLGYLKPADRNHRDGDPPNLYFANSLSDVRHICAESKNILLTSWVPSPSLRETIDSTSFTDLPELSSVIQKEQIHLLPEMIEGSLGQGLLQELLPSITAFSHLLPEHKIRVMLIKTLGQTCPLFHVDRVTLRMLGTFRGPGTEWLADSEVIRKGLGHGDNDKMMTPGATIRWVPLFSLCILKGEAFKGNTGRGIVHRSPSVPRTSDGRWYIRVDFDD
jgi:hypothetical protein